MDDHSLILGIESSCDETAAAVVRDGWDVRSSIIATQYELHEEYGGVVPEIASRAHLERIYPVVKHALDKSGIASIDDISAVAVGHRPGLIGSLLVGVAAAKALAWAWSKPLIGVDHVISHLYAAALQDRDSDPSTSRIEIAFPALGLVVSGGHTTLYRMRSPLDIIALGRTIDDAIGEAYDKAAMMLGLGFPGGPVVDQRAHRGNQYAHDFPVARLEAHSLDFSFSGLKTSLLYAVRGTPTGRGRDAVFQRTSADLTPSQIDDLCASFQRAAVAAITFKVNRALDDSDRCGLTDARSLIVGGGVSANRRLRADLSALAHQRGLAFHIPALAWCMDNAAMIAGQAHHRLMAGLTDSLSLAPSPAGSVSLWR